LTGLVYVALGGTALVSGGCLAAAAGAAGGAAVGYVYYKGKVNQEYNASFDDTWAATQRAMTELGMPLVKQERQGPSGWMEFRTNMDDRVRITLDQMVSPVPAEGALTRLGIRVRTFGDQALSERILNQIGAHLVARPAPVAVTAPTWAPGGAPPQPAIRAAGGVVPETREPPLLNAAPTR
jgi:hypothetical protein